MIVQDMKEDSQLREQRMVVIARVGHQSFRPPGMPPRDAQIELLARIEAIVFGRFAGMARAISWK